MAVQSRAPAVPEEQERGLLGQIEVHPIDWIPDTGRHGRTGQQAMAAAGAEPARAPRDGE